MLGAHILFVDETGCLLIPTVRNTWAVRGKTPILRHCYRRDRISVISGISISAERERLGLYWRFHRKNIASDEIISFLTYLSRHIPGNLMVIWDGCPTHRSRKVKEFLSSHPRIYTERFPGYAPEINPDEFVWAHLKRDASNATPDNLSTLGRLLVKSLYRVKRSQKLLQSCVNASDLPWRKK